ncbi:hypothetical protein [Granulicella arctica]|uniref:hypothetical protein n=1 Tax=Granulicella arctica TaxID=940613 RepID=UPI0021E085B8|nr:hypothetical protein [Granulicella arctica]
MTANAMYLKDWPNMLEIKLWFARFILSLKLFRIAKVYHSRRRHNHPKNPHLLIFWSGEWLCCLER